MIQEFIDYMRENKGSAARSCTEYEKDLRYFARWAAPRKLRWSTINEQDIEAYVSEQTKRGLKPSTIQKRVSCLRTMLRWALHRMLISENPAQYTQTPKRAATVPDPVEMSELRTGLRRQVWTTKQAEAQVISQVIVDTGMRLTEVLHLRLEDFDKTNMLIKITGKGNKERYVPYTQETRIALGRWWKATGRLFERTQERAMREEIAKLFSYTGKRVHPHMLRHTFAVNAIDKGVSLHTLQLLLGHTSITTTEIYTRTAKGIKRMLEAKHN